MTTRKRLLLTGLVLLAALVAGGVLSWYIHGGSPPSTPPALSEIERAVMDAKEALAVAEQASREAMSIRQSLAREVRARNEAIHKEVADYDAVRIARELNIFCSDER